MSAEVVNLRAARKAKIRAERKRAAEANRVKYGRTRAEREQTEAEARRVAERLDGAKREKE